MPDIFFFITIFFGIGAAGTFAGSRKHTPTVRRERWLKFFVHLVLVYAVVSVLVFWPDWFRWVALLIVLGGAVELVKVQREGLAAGQHPGMLFHLVTFVMYAGMGWGFWRMAEAWDSKALVALFILVFTFDGFSQVFGQMFGRRKLFPVVSPGKTVEGLLGGLLMTQLTAWFYCRPELSNWSFIAAGLFVSAGALLGDWLASYYKRKHGVKDFSALIPGHGGILDRFDSWMVAGALGWVVGLFY
jgi:phosphatidate cytidylyltransferase